MDYVVIASVLKKLYYQYISKEDCFSKVELVFYLHLPYLFTFTIEGQWHLHQFKKEVLFHNVLMLKKNFLQNQPRKSR